MFSNWQYRLPPGYAPSQKMLDEVGFDFDNDLGGLKKGPRHPRPHLHRAWRWTMFATIILLVCMNPVYGAGLVSGVAIGIVATLYG